MSALNEFSLQGKRAFITGGAGVLCQALARGFAQAGAEVVLADLREDAAEAAAEALRKEGFKASSVGMNVLEMESIQKGVDAMEKLGGIDILVNGAGGNQKQATTSPDLSFFDLPLDALRRVIDLNLFGGAILTSQAFGREMVKKPEGGVILNISSMNALRPLTRIPGYSAAKAAVSNFTQWLSTHLAQEYNTKLRVNAIAPGFFLTDQNRFLLTDEKTGELTARGKTIMAHTPMGRFGSDEDLVGTAIWLCSDASRFVTGIVVPVDGGFSAFSGV
ncbi:SDR family oxidoreductase [Candidatus Sumerlaeota bacterium]|nr:SDR family oxidoreductase [Candidatus Sumerlaeota bacterium]